MAERVRVMAQRVGMKDAEAQQEIERFDAANSRALSAAFNIDWSDALLYHVVLNSARVSVDACVKVVCELAQDERFADERATKSALADKQLEAKVRAALVEFFGSGDMAAIKVVVLNGKIVLNGVTSAGGLSAKAEKCAREINGVNEIENCIISVPSHGRPSF
jgi:osmotically-inducible protein OsmY